MTSKQRGGFTLIELLVVIAIIGILSSVVLASLSTARSRGNDAKAQSQISNMRAAMETYYSSNNNYGTSSTANGCSASPSAAPWNDATSGMAALSDTDNYPSGTTVTCYTNGTAWAAQATLSGNRFFCADSSGNTKTDAATMLGGTAPDTSC